MIKNAPSLESITEKVIEIMEENIEIAGELKKDAPLAAGLGLDSLDLIETSFSLQEFFEFDFSDKNAMEALNEVMGGELIIADGLLTDLGREMVLKRMPELSSVELPEKLTAAQLQQYFTVETFARLILEFYQAAPETCPETGESVVVKDFKIVAENSGTPVKTLSGDEIIDRWVNETVPVLQG